MSISRLAGAAGFSAVMVLAFSRCSPGPTQCNRYSDCDPGLTCAYGRCVFPPVPADDGGDGAIGEAGSPIDAADEGGDGADSAVGDEASATDDDAPGDDSSSEDASSD